MQHREHGPVDLDGGDAVEMRSPEELAQRIRDVDPGGVEEGLLPDRARVEVGHAQPPARVRQGTVAHVVAR